MSLNYFPKHCTSFHIHYLDMRDSISPTLANTLYCHLYIVVPFYPGGISSKISSGWLKPWVVQNSIYGMFFPHTYIHFATFLWHIELQALLQNCCKNQSGEKPSSTQRVEELMFITPVVPEELGLWRAGPGAQLQLCLLKAYLTWADWLICSQMVTNHESCYGL